MAFDFPSSPSEGQIFNAPGGPSYVFNSPVWKAVGQGQIAIISDTPPASPANGALWYESDSGILFIWYNDGNSSQWVQVGGIMQPPPPVEASGVFKISSGLGTVGAASFDIALPTGYLSFELQIVGYQPSATAILVGVFSWDNGATFPQVASSYSAFYVTSGSTNAVSDTRGVFTTLVFGQGQATASTKSNYRIWIPVVDATSRPGMQFQQDGWNGSEYRQAVGAGEYAGASIGPPTHLRIFMGGGATFAVETRWQLNGVK